MMILCKNSAINKFSFDGSIIILLKMVEIKKFRISVKTSLMDMLTEMFYTMLVAILITLIGIKIKISDQKWLLKCVQKMESKLQLRLKIF